MKSETSVHPLCPFPGECPLGPKANSYHCGLAAPIKRRIDGNMVDDVVCTFCFQYVMGFQAYLNIRKQQAGGLVVPPAGAFPPDLLAGPGNNGKG